MSEWTVYGAPGSAALARDEVRLWHGGHLAVRRPALAALGWPTDGSPITLEVVLNGEPGVFGLRPHTSGYPYLLKPVRSGKQAEASYWRVIGLTDVMHKTVPRGFHQAWGGHEWSVEGNVLVVRLHLVPDDAEGTA